MSTFLEPIETDDGFSTPPSGYTTVTTHEILSPAQQVEMDHAQRINQSIALGIFLQNTDVPIKVIQLFARGDKTNGLQSHEFENRWQAWREWQEYIEKTRTDIFRYLRQKNPANNDLYDAYYQQLLTPVNFDVMVMIEKLLCLDEIIDKKKKSEIIEKVKTTGESNYENRDLVFTLVKQICLNHSTGREGTLELLENYDGLVNIPRGRGTVLQF